MRTSILLTISALIALASSGGVLVAQTGDGTSAASMVADQAQGSGARNVAFQPSAKDESMAAGVSKVQTFAGRSLEAEDETIGLNMARPNYAITPSRAAQGGDASGN